jgi:hypothetical protein
MKINLFYPKCKFCGDETRKIKIYYAPDKEHLDQKVFRHYGLRCLKCNKINENFIYEIRMEDPCCKGMDENFSWLESGISPSYDSSLNLITWDISGEEESPLSDIKFCPFCGTELPTKPNSFPL